MVIAMGIHSYRLVSLHTKSLSYSWTLPLVGLEIVRIEELSPGSHASKRELVQKGVEETLSLSRSFCTHTGEAVPGRGRVIGFSPSSPTSPNSHVLFFPSGGNL